MARSMEVSGPSSVSQVKHCPSPSVSAQRLALTLFGRGFCQMSRPLFTSRHSSTCRRSNFGSLSSGKMRMSITAWRPRMRMFPPSPPCGPDFAQRTSRTLSIHCSPRIAVASVSVLTALPSAPPSKCVQSPIPVGRATTDVFHAPPFR